MLIVILVEKCSLATKLLNVLKMRCRPGHLQLSSKQINKKHMNKELFRLKKRKKKN